MTDERIIERVTWGRVRTYTQDATKSSNEMNKDLDTESDRSSSSMPGYTFYFGN